MTPSVSELLRAWRGDGHAEKCGCALCTAIAEIEAVAKELREKILRAPDLAPHPKQIECADRLAKEGE